MSYHNSLYLAYIFYHQILKKIFKNLTLYKILLLLKVSLFEILFEKYKKLLWGYKVKNAGKNAILHTNFKILTL